MTCAGCARVGQRRRAGIGKRPIAGHTARGHSPETLSRLAAVLYNVLLGDVALHFDVLLFASNELALSTLSESET